MNIIQRFKSLPVKSRSLLSIGIAVALVVALPLFIWGIMNLTFDLRERASSGEPEVTPTATPTSTGTYTPPPTACASVPMTLTITPNEQSGNPGTTKRYTVDITNNDSAGCGEHTVILIPGIPSYAGYSVSGWTVNFVTQNFTIGAHETYRTYVDVKSPTANYSYGQHEIAAYLFSVNIPENATYQTFIYNLTGTQTPSPTPTATPNPSGEPNNCNGTCGSNYNCQGGLFCSGGYCRNPLCPNSSSCNCAATTTTTPAAKKTTTAKPTATMDIVYLKGSSAKPNSTPKVSASATASPKAVASKPAFKLTDSIKKYGLWGLLVIGVILVLSAIGNMFKKKDEGPNKINLNNENKEKDDSTWSNPPTPPTT